MLLEAPEGGPGLLDGVQHPGGGHIARAPRPPPDVAHEAGVGHPQGRLSVPRHQLGAAGQEGGEEGPRREPIGRMDKSSSPIFSGRWQ